MNLFLSVVPVDDAIATLKSLVPTLPPESIPLQNATGRVLADIVKSDIDIPGFNRSMVDGYALDTRDNVGATESHPAMLHLKGSIPMGSMPELQLLRDECIYIPTGGVLPPGADAVVMVEHTELVGDTVLIRRPVAPGENVVIQGEDFKRGEVVLNRGHVIRPQDVGVLAAIGSPMVKVRVIPKIGVVSTGNEVIPIERTPAVGQIRDVNSYMIGSFITAHACIPTSYGIVRDEKAELISVLMNATSECDAVLISGGSSKDARDVCAAAIEELGEVLVHGIAIQPGKPTIIGVVRGKPVIGVPGHPASAFIVLTVIVRPFLEEMSQRKVVAKVVRAKVAQNIPSAKGREEYVRVTLRNGSVTPLFGKSGLLNTLIGSEGVVRIPAHREGLEAGEEVDVILW